MQTLMRVIGAATLSGGLLFAGACKRSDRTTADEVTAEQRVEQAQRESEKAFEAAREAQEEARDEQEDVADADEEVIEKQRELAEAQRKAEEERLEAEQAQQQATAQGAAAQQAAQSAQARAEQAQHQSRAEAQARATATPRRSTDTSMTTGRTMTDTSATDTSPDTQGMGSRAPVNDPWANTRPDSYTPSTTQPSSEVSTDTSTTRPSSEISTGTTTDTTTGAASGAVVKTDEGIVQSVSGEHIVIQRDNGSQLRLRVDSASMTMPSEGQRVRVQYRFDGMIPVAVRIE